MRAWIDIENAPQVQYLAPFVDALRERGFDVTVTARATSITVDLLEARGIEPIVVDAISGGWKARKVLGIGARAAKLTRRMAIRRPELLIAPSRSGALAAWALRIPCFEFCDYEHVDLRVARLTRSWVLHPDAIGTSAFTRRGLHVEQLIPFRGLKEGISFSGMDVARIPAHSFPTLEHTSLIRMLFRPPGEETHYYVRESREFAIELLDFLAARSDVAVIFSPRYAWQASYLERVRWANEPVLLEEAVPFVSLLKAADAVVSAGGTMLREAAYLGIPAYSIFRSEIGQVDCHLESLGRLTILRSRADFAAIRFASAALDPMQNESPDLVGDLVDEMIERVAARRARQKWRRVGNDPPPNPVSRSERAREDAPVR